MYARMYGYPEIVNIFQSRRKANANDFSDCELKPNSFVFPDYDDIKDFLAAVRRGEEASFLFHKYESQNKIFRVPSYNEFEVLKVAGDIAMIMYPGGMKVFIPKNFLDCQ